MRVLITNDDGIEAPWLTDLAEGFSAEDHEVTVVAPAADCSGMSGALAPLVLGGVTDVGMRRRTDLPAVAAWGAEACSPSMCVLIGLGGFVDGPVDLVVSGVNYGWNLGRDIWRSGTAWAAITAWGMGVPALAVSAAPAPYPREDRREAVERTVVVAKQLVDAPEPQLWNLNFPYPPAERWGEATWVPMTPSERLSRTSVTVVEHDESGDAVVRLQQPPDLEVEGVDGSDAAVVQAGGVTLTRLRPIDSVAAD